MTKRYSITVTIRRLDDHGFSPYQNTVLESFVRFTGRRREAEHEAFKLLGKFRDKNLERYFDKKVKG